MDIASLLLSKLDSLQLQRLGPDTEAGLWISSLPWPRSRQQNISLGNHPTYVEPVGHWPGEPEGTPRRLLLIADSANAAPERVGVGPASAGAPGEAPEAEAELFDRCTEEGFMWERHLLRIRWGGKSIGLIMGLRHEGEVHWWEACRLVVRRESPTCRVVEMGGAIPRKVLDLEELAKYTRYSNPFLHNHNWLNGRIVARLHANGVCEVYAHHINSRFFDGGKDLEDVVPVLGIAADTTPEELRPLCGPWTGQREGFEIGDARFDLSEVARLATPGQPGHLDYTDREFVVLQPYEGVELYSGIRGRQLRGDPFICYSSQRTFPRGMARTLRFSLSLSDRSPRVARYLPPAWWYGLCEEFMPEPLLPVSNGYDKALEGCREFTRKFMVRGGFEDGAIPRGGNPCPGPLDRGRSEAGWEGEAPYAMMLLAWRSGDAQDYEDALRASYHFTDVAIDHAAKMVRMHGYDGGAFALPMNRVLCSIAAFLETGDPYLIEAAQAVVDNSHWTQLNSWPRNAVGRDSKYVRSAALLYRYLGDEHYRKIAQEGAKMAATSQRPQGTFGDQAGGSGIHQWGAFITKPWMALMCTEGILDYLQLFPEEPGLAQCVIKLGDWLLSECLERDGERGWGYQHEFDGKNRHFDFQSGEWWDLPRGEPGPLHESLGRLMLTCSMHTGNPDYFNVWADTRRWDRKVGGDHGLSATGQYIPWVQAKLWQATLTPDGIHARPSRFGPLTPKEATILTPQGPVQVAWNEDGAIDAPANVRIDLSSANRL